MRAPLVLVAGFLCAVGCIPAVANRLDGRSIDKSRVTAAPPRIVFYDLDLTGTKVPQEERLRAVEASVGSFLTSVMSENGASVTSSEAVQACGTPCHEFLRGGMLATAEIALQRAQAENFNRHSVGDWSFHGDLAPVQSAFGADYVLLTFLRQVRDTTGRQIATLAAGTPMKQVAAICLADLREGSMAWCASSIDGRATNLDAPNRARDLIARLMCGTFRLPADVPCASTAP